MASDYDACGPVPFEAPHRTKPGLEAPVVSLDPVVGILGGVVQCDRQEVRDHADQGVGPVSGDLSRLTVRADRIGEECCRSSQITLPGHEHVDEQGREPLNPPEQGHVVNLDTAFSEQLLQIPVGQSVTQVPAHGDQDDLGREPEPCESRNGGLDGSDETATLHPNCLVHSRPRHEPQRFQASSRSTQQCPALSLEPVFRRSHGSLHKALARGRIDVEALRQLLVANRPQSWPAVFAVDASTLDRCDAETSPERGFYYSASKHSAGQPIVAGWSYQWIAQLGWAPDSWTAPLDAMRIPPTADTT